jgi:hypothetical protein
VHSTGPRTGQFAACLLALARREAPVECTVTVIRGGFEVRHPLRGRRAQSINNHFSFRDRSRG